MARGPVSHVTSGPDAVCTERLFALSAANYTHAVNMGEFFDLVHSNYYLSSCMVVAADATGTYATVTQTSALTATSTEYGDFVAPQQVRLCFLNTGCLSR